MNIFMPINLYFMLQEKINLLKVLGADVRPVPAVPFDNPDNYNHQVLGDARIQIHFAYIALGEYVDKFDRMQAVHQILPFKSCYLYATLVQFVPFKYFLFQFIKRFSH